MNDDTVSRGARGPGKGAKSPLERLASCHVRMARECETLRQLELLPAGLVPDDQAREAAASVLRYFDGTAVQHHADEEEDLFPALLESMAGSDAVCLRELTAGLAREHRLLDAAWRRVRGPLEQLAGGAPAAWVAGDAESFVALSLSHIEREDSELLPMAARLLTDDDLARIGSAMETRRAAIYQAGAECPGGTDGRA